MQKIRLNIANRIYPLKVNPSQEEVLRKASKQINDMIIEYEKKYAVQDKQDSLAMCALQIISQSKKYHAHDESNAFKVGDIVKIIESKPISKLKSWTVVYDNQEKI